MQLEQILKRGGIVDAETLESLMDGDIYQDLFDYWYSTGEMPYGTAKARTGDPHLWIYEATVNFMGW